MNGSTASELPPMILTHSPSKSKCSCFQKKVFCLIYFLLNASSMANHLATSLTSVAQNEQCSSGARRLQVLSLFGGRKAVGGSQKITCEEECPFLITGFQSSQSHLIMPEKTVKDFTPFLCLGFIIPPPPSRFHYLVACHDLFTFFTHVSRQSMAQLSKP
ncbi:hypothetical protein DM01DRAFT_1006357 [Hesseltinella vesiculosa]|uniref:Uncharacterized protein n=1 Tax=Hesseltinella vesiculosa TaxID=101127 RepID=A0A1X2GXI4_9FUNG|nr:hypothetical protein DM01DRAFT_1006357 [Hesseltinella vesiculosa]